MRNDFGGIPKGLSQMGAFWLPERVTRHHSGVPNPTMTAQQSGVEGKLLGEDKACLTIRLAKS